MELDAETQFMILDAYGQATFAARERGITGIAARKAALAATARATTKATGLPITAEIVERLVNK